MNYVGQLAGSVLGRVRELYNGVNPATLSGSIDVVVVRQPDGSFRSSPFHVRFGKLGILHSAEMAVDIEVNGEPVDLQMRLGENGEAFFIQNVEETEVPHPSLTTPQNTFLLHPNDALSEASSASHSPLSPLDIPTRRQRWVKRLPRNRGDESPDTPGKDIYTTMPTSESIYFSFSEVVDDGCPSQCKDSLVCSEEDPLCLSTSSRSPSPKSDSELEMRVPSSPASENCMEWDWGKLPQVSRPELNHQISQSAPSSPTRELQTPFECPDSELSSTTQECDTLHSAPDSVETTEAHVPTDTSSECPPLHPDDVLSPDSQEVSLYFPNSEPHPPPPPHYKEDTEDVSEDNMESLTSYVDMSLCGGLTDTWNIPEGRFLKYKISYSDFCQNPSLIDNPLLVLRIHNKFYNWATAAPILLCKQAFNQELPQGVVEQLLQQKMPPRSRGWWFSWRRRSLPNQLPMSNPKDNVETKEDTTSSSLRLKEKQEEITIPPVQPPPYRKSLRLTSEQIRSLNLHSGANEVVFSVCTKFQGTCRTRAEIYLWESTDRIVISDIDGTVTRSDALGHILPQLGKDWTQKGIVQLYNAIYRNDYKFLYCSARSVGLAEITKTYLRGVNDGGVTLPPGPLLLSPSSLFAALHREVIEKTPEHFKIACLSDIGQLFPDSHPFHAAFGNRPNDVLAYREVGVPESRIFTVNPKGELTQDLNTSFKSSYTALSELVNFMFPPLSADMVSALLSSEYSDFSYWRGPLSSVGEEELAHITAI